MNGQKRWFEPELYPYHMMYRSQKFMGQMHGFWVRPLYTRQEGNQMQQKGGQKIHNAN